LADAGVSTDAMPDWSSKSVSVEHIFARSLARDAFSSDEDFDRFVTMRDQLQNLTLLERTLNTSLDDTKFENKVDTYAKSAFVLTRDLGELSEWTVAEGEKRAARLADLALRAWPA
jgi:Protein of unknown function (DUF1524)